MKQVVTQAIVLARTNYGEADRIVTLLTPEHGKLRVMARGVRKAKSKLAAGIELFSVSTITYRAGRSELGTLMSSRLEHHYGAIVSDIDRTMFGYELLKQIHRATEDECERAYFELLKTALQALASDDVSIDVVRVWFGAQLLRLGGHAPNLANDVSGKPLAAGRAYMFYADDAALAEHPEGIFDTPRIKLLRLLFSDTLPQALARVAGCATLLPACEQLVQTMRNTYIRV